MSRGLRAADALQLAAAITFSEGAPGMPLVTLDERMADAADREGFEALRPAAPYDAFGDATRPGRSTSPKGRR